jgi:hypothetical protein
MSGAPLCVGCRFFNGMNQRDLCLFYGHPDTVRGWVTSPRRASSERAPRFLWFGKARCGPEGAHFEAEPPMQPPGPSK